MKPQIKDKLVLALESGDYTKAIGALSFTKADGSACHCVLGVLCDLYEQETGGRKGKLIYHEMVPLGAGYGATKASVGEYIDEKGLLAMRRKGAVKVASILGYLGNIPDRIQDWAGLSRDELVHLYRWNDVQRLSFTKIAQKIRLSF